jgi:hypothetical protein
MSRHSKNNTSSMVFTNYERQLAGYGIKKDRLGADSIKKFDACSLCLHSVVDALAEYVFLQISFLLLYNLEAFFYNLQ